jgi:hypothetical protein
LHTISKYNQKTSQEAICEQAHQQLKEELALDHFVGRSWKPPVELTTFGIG